MKDFFSKRPEFTDLPSFLVILNPQEGGFNVVEIPGFEADISEAAFGYCNVEGITPLENFLLGHAFGENEAHFTRQYRGLEWLQDQNPLGCYLSLEKNKNSYQYRTDPSGQSTLFYGKISGTTFVTNRLLLLAEYFADLGRKLPINLGAAYLLSSSDSAIAMHAMVRQTVFEGINLLLPGETLAVTFSGNIEVEGPRKLGNLLTYREYRDELVQCADRITKRFITATQWMDSVTIALTAGVDSRTVFALAISTTDTKKLKRLTWPKAPIDSFGSFHLGDRYDVAAVSENSGYEPADFDVLNYVAANLSEWFGVNGEISPPKIEQALYSGPLINGGGGEIHRTFYRNRFLHSVPNYTFTYSECTGRSFFDLIYSGKLSAQAKSLMKTAFVRELNSLPGCTLAEKLEHHYRFYRNRFHFRGSLNGEPRCFNRMNLSPLMDGDLFELSSRTPIDFKCDDKVLKDLSEYWVPGITRIAYNEQLAEQHSIQMGGEFRGARKSKYDLWLSDEFQFAQQQLTERFSITLEKLAEQALEILIHSGKFVDIAELGRKRMIWMKTLKGHNFQYVWPMRLIQLARLVIYTD